MLHWAAAPALALVVAFGGSLAHFASDHDRGSLTPGGTRLAFTRDPGKILTMAPDGAHLRQVPFERSANAVDWVPSR